MAMNGLLILQLLILLAAANGAPILAKRFLGGSFAHALDLGTHLPDARPLLGPTKTIRGIVASLVLTCVAAYLIGQPVLVGAAVSLAAMAGDLTSSFVKRRLGLPPSSMAIGLDQIPECLVPLLVVQFLVPLTFAEIATTILVFFVGDLLLSRVLFWLRVRDTPY